MMRRFRNLAYDLAILACVLLFVVSIVKLTQYVLTNNEQKNINSSLQQMKEEEESKGTEEEIEETEVKQKNKKILKQYKKLYNKNQDMWGWIQIKGTEVNYPVMYTPNDSNFYEKRNWKKEKIDVGSCIWIDGRVTENSKNIIIYGHNMRNGSMFGPLKKYKGKEFYKKHKYIQLDTLYEEQTFEIISVSCVNSNDKCIYGDVDLESKEDFSKYVKNVKEKAYYDIKTESTYPDQLITLSTCNGNDRTIVVAKRIDK